MLEDAAPAKVEVELLVLEKNVEKLSLTKIGDCDLFVDADKSGNNASDTANADGTGRGNTKLCDIASKVESKTAEVSNLVKEIPESVGIKKRAQIRQPTPPSTTMGHSLTFAPGLETSAECVYYASGDEGRVKVSLHLVAYAPDKAAYLVAMQEKEKAHEGIGLTHLVVRKPRENSDEDEEDVDINEEDKEPEANEVIWFREEKEFIRVLWHLDNAEGEWTSMKYRLEKGNSDSGNVMVHLIEAEHEYLRRKKKYAPWPVKLACLMGISLKLLNDNFWAMDNETNRETKKLLNCIASYWKTKALPQSDTVFGLGVPGDAESAKTSREALLNFLAKLKKEYETMEPDTFGYKFNCLPSNTRKKLRSAGCSLSSA